MRKGSTPVQLVVALGLGRIFDVPSHNSSRTSSPSSSASSADDGNDDPATFGCFGDHLYGKGRSTPEGVRVVTVSGGLDSSTTMGAVLLADGSRCRSQWLVVWVRGSTTVMVIPPKEARRGYAGLGLTGCLEWLEVVGMSQVLFAVPRNEENESLCKSLLFLGFSRLPKEVKNAQLPGWCEGYTVLYMDFNDS